MVTKILTPFYTERGKSGSAHATNNKKCIEILSVRHGFLNKGEFI